MTTESRRIRVRRGVIASPKEETVEAYDHRVSLNLPVNANGFTVAVPSMANAIRAFSALSVSLGGGGGNVGDPTARGNAASTYTTTINPSMALIISDSFRVETQYEVMYRRTRVEFAIEAEFRGQRHPLSFGISIPQEYLENTNVTNLINMLISEVDRAGTQMLGSLIYPFYRDSMLSQVTGAMRRNGVRI